MSKTLMPKTGVSLAGESHRTWNDVEVDPITLRVIGGALQSMAKEMAQVLYRMAYSSLIRESEDLGAGIFDINGRELCESDSTPMHCGSIPPHTSGASTVDSPARTDRAMSSCTTTRTTRSPLPPRLRG